MKIVELNREIIVYHTRYRAAVRLVHDAVRESTTLYASDNIKTE
jgi:hypothetical protein